MTPEEMIEVAKQHDGRYLLQRRFSPGDVALDAKYECAEWLVSNGYACWISTLSSKYPGIILTSRADAPPKGGKKP